MSGKIVDSLVKNLIMPVVGKICGGPDFSSYFIMLSAVPADFKGPMTFIIFMMVRQVNRIK